MENLVKDKSLGQLPEHEINFEPFPKSINNSEVLRDTNLESSIWRPQEAKKEGARTDEEKAEARVNAKE